MTGLLGNVAKFFSFGKKAPAQEADHASGVGRDFYEVIRQSGYFDSRYYLEMYPDAARSDLDPLEHYLSQPATPPRNPSELFDAAFYLAANTDVAMARVNPLFHYVRYGRDEGRRSAKVRARAPRATAPNWPLWEDLARQLGPTAEAGQGGVHIVVPVYRGLDETANCLYTLLLSRVGTELPCRVTVINDKSPEPELTELLQRIASLGLFTLLENETNLGFVGTVNRGMGLLPGHDVILLNSDTEVFGNWVERLHASAHGAPNIGTVTPFSNNATICSYPCFCENFMLPFETSFAEIDRLASLANAGDVVDIPTGVGFCMYIRRDCLDEVGLFSQELFGLGYGEENDFCQRAIRKGWRNVLCTDTFVRHLGCTSFLDSSDERTRNAVKILNEIYPDYLSDVGEFCKADPSRQARERLDMARLKRMAGERAVLFVSHGVGGGTEQHMRDMMELLAREGIGSLVLRPMPQEALLDLGHPAVLDVPNLRPWNFGDGPAALAEALAEMGFFHIHVHHLFGFPLEMPDFITGLAEALGAEFDFTAHDYMPICPRINMIDDSGAYCGNTEVQRCQACVERNNSSFGKVSMWRWRVSHDDFLRRARQVYVPHSDVKKRLNGVLPRVPIQVRTHPELMSAMDFEPISRQEGEQLRVAVIGAIGPHKGSAVLMACAEEALKSALPITFIVIGYCNLNEIKKLKNVVVTGPYKPEELPSLLEKYRCHLAFFPFVWPETYSYTLSLAFAAGLYPVCFDLGAPAGRIRECNWGELLPLELRLKPGELNKRLLDCIVPPKPAGLTASLGCSYEHLLGDYYGLLAEQVLAPKEPESAPASAPAVPEAFSAHVATCAGRYGELSYYDFDAVIGRSLTVYGEWGQKELDFLADLIDEGAVVIDGGAHVGVYAQAFARFTGPRGRVVAFEPNPVLHPLLIHNTAASSAEVVAFHAALDAGPGVVHIPLLRATDRINLGALTLRQMVGPQSAHAAPVPVMTIDSLGLTQLDFIKLDLEGMESLALAGAWKTIAALQPLIYLECNHAAGGWACISAVQDLGYKAVLCRFPAYNPQNLRGHAKNFFGPANESGLLLVPARAFDRVEQRLVGEDAEHIGGIDDLAQALKRTPRYGDVTIIDRSMGELSKDIAAWSVDAHRLLQDLTDQKMWSDRDRHLAMFLREAWNATPQSAEAEAAQHGLAAELLAALERSGLFSEHFYHTVYPGVVVERTTALYHFLTEGWKLGYCPGPGFDVFNYLQANPGVRQSGHNPLLHYIFHGLAEGRSPV